MGKDYKCVSCGYELSIPEDVLYELTNGDYDESNPPHTICPHCQGILSAKGHSKPVHAKKRRSFGKSRETRPRVYADDFNYIGRRF